MHSRLTSLFEGAEVRKGVGTPPSTVLKNEDEEERKKEKPAPDVRLG
jgi:hypothetical protein